MALLGALAPYIAAAIAGLVVLRALRRQRTRQTLPFPPGPKPLPLIGNLLNMPKEKEWLTYRAWNEQYGEIVSIDVFGQKIVVLGSAAVVHDLLERRSSMYSDRPITPMLKLMDFDWAFSLAPYGEVWRRKRKLMHAHMHQGVVDRYHPIQVASARRLARDILITEAKPESISRAVCLNFGQTIVKTMYGIEVEGHQSEYITLAEEVTARINEAAVPGRFLIDFIPALKYVPAWLPGAGFQRLAQQNRVLQHLLINNPIGVARGTAPPSVAHAMLTEDTTLPKAQSQLELIKEVTGVAYLAGTDTTAAAVIVFFLAMLVYPEVQVKAQAEIDRVVGTDRLPDLEDQEQMPYVQGVVNECLRWLPVAPLAIPHRAINDDHYKGYLIPKGSIIIGSTWSILHNPNDYPEPGRFNPERYLAPDGSLDPSVRDPRTACFGFGRRICPGRYFADNSLFLTISTLLATIHIVRAQDTSGIEMVPEVETMPGLLSLPKPFPWAVHSRGRQAEELLANSKGN